MDSKTIEALKLMVGKADEVFFVFDADQLVVTYVNGAFETITGRKPEELSGEPGILLGIIHKEDLGTVEQNVQLLLQKTTDTLLEFRICRLDGLERWISLKVYPVVENGKVTCLTGIAADDTARKLEILNLQKVNGWNTADLQTLSHDLCGPIGIVQMMSSVISKKVPDNPEIHKLTQVITEISQRNIKLIQNVFSGKAIDRTAADQQGKDNL